MHSISPSRGLAEYLRCYKFVHVVINWNPCYLLLDNLGADLEGMNRVASYPLLEKQNIKKKKIEKDCVNISAEIKALALWTAAGTLLQFIVCGIASIFGLTV